MKILKISDSIKNIGGAEKVVYDIKNVLEQNNHIVYLWGTKKEKINQSIFSIFNIKYFFKLRNYLRKNKFDIIHIHKFNMILSPAIFLAIPKKTKIIVHVHDFSFCCYRLGVDKNMKECEGGLFHSNCLTYENRKFEFVFNFVKWFKLIVNRYFLKKYVDFFICPSRKLRKMMIKSLNLPVEKVIYLPNFIEIEKNYQPDFSKIDSKKFLFVGRISKEKGVNVAIKAIDYLVKKEGLKDIKLEIIGDGPEKSNLEKLVKRLGLDDNIKFLGRVDNEKLGEYYEKACAVLMPSVWLENNPLVAIEGMKFGTPIIASNVGGYPDLVEDEKNGYLFEMGDYKEMAEKIKKLYGKEELSKQMGEKGFEKLKKEFSKDLFWERLEKIYKS